MGAILLSVMLHFFILYRVNWSFITGVEYMNICDMSWQYMPNNDMYLFL